MKNELDLKSGKGKIIDDPMANLPDMDTEAAERTRQAAAQLLEGGYSISEADGLEPLEALRTFKTVTNFEVMWFSSTSMATY